MVKTANRRAATMLPMAILELGAAAPVNATAVFEAEAVALLDLVADVWMDVRVVEWTAAAVVGAGVPATKAAPAADAPATVVKAT